jgi:hypothetical protein
MTAGRLKKISDVIDLTDEDIDEGSNSPRSAHAGRVDFYDL